jgi:segregation and condensation protein A
VVIAQDPEQFAQIAGRALMPKPVATVSISHVHAPRVSVREQAAIMVDRLRRHSVATFRSLVADCDTTLLVVARFLALLELYREGSVAFDQVTPLGELHIRWTGPAEGEVDLVAEEYDGAPVLADEAAATSDSDPDVTVDVTENVDEVTGPAQEDE